MRARLSIPRLVRPLWLAGALAGAPASANEALILSCPVCHGTPQAPSQVPSFYGRTPQEIRARLAAYRDGTLDGTSMPRLSAPLSDAEIDALAQHFGVPR